MDILRDILVVGLLACLACLVGFLWGTRVKRERHTPRRPKVSAVSEPTIASSRSKTSSELALDALTAFAFGDTSMKVQTQPMQLTTFERMDTWRIIAYRGTRYRALVHVPTWVVAAHGGPIAPELATLLERLWMQFERQEAAQRAGLQGKDPLH